MTLYTPILRAVTDWWSIQYHPRGHWCYFGDSFGNQRYRRWMVLKNGIEVSCHYTPWGAARAIREGVVGDLSVMESMLDQGKIAVSPDGMIVSKMRADGTHANVQ